MSSLKQIEDEFFRQLHPVLSSKGMKMAGLLARGLAKGALKIDLPGDGKDSLSLGVPEIKLGEFLSGPADQLIVFDDLERCMMPMSDVLGYINAFVEHEDMKVIILANESEIIKRDDRFPEIKEKLIGQTLKVRSDVLAAFPEFLKNVTSMRVRQLFSTHQNTIIAVHAESATNNLRILKQAMWDFERLAINLDDAAWEKKEAIFALLKLTLALSMEVRAGRLRTNDLPELLGNSLSRYLRSERNEDPDKGELIDKRYANIQLNDPPFRPDILGKIIIEGLSDAELIKDTLKESRHFTEPSAMPVWRRAWHGFEMPDDEYIDAFNELTLELAKGEIAE